MTLLPLVAHADAARLATLGGGTDADALTAVTPIIDDVAREGDAAVLRAAARFGEAPKGALRVEPAAFAAARRAVGRDVRQALERAARDIRKFARLQAAQLADLDVAAGGARVGHRVLALERAGVYVPAGKHPLPSTALMGVIPARVAGVREVVVCSPPTLDGDIHPAVLVAAELAGADAVFRVGGAQAVAAMAAGTATIPRVDKVVGPGNRFVAAAKSLVALRGWCGIDVLAGPSELGCVVDGSVAPELAAGELLAQAEHDPAARLWLLATSDAARDAVLAALPAALDALPSPNRDDARASLARGAAVTCPDLAAAAALANRLGPEHLSLLIRRPAQALRRFTAYGSAFLGPFTPVAMGDYGVGPNHTLPTGGAARFASGLSVFSFVRWATHVELSAHAFARLGPGVEALAALEGLHAHARTVRLRVDPERPRTRSSRRSR